MTEITHFVALAFDLIDGGLVAGEPVDCASPAVAIQTAQGQWKILGHAGAVAFSRTSDFGKGKFNQRHVLRRFGQVPDAYIKEKDDPSIPDRRDDIWRSISAASAQGSLSLALPSRVNRANLVPTD